MEKADAGQPRLYIDMRHCPAGIQVYDMLMDWIEKSEALRNKEISQDEYDEWKYHYPSGK